MIETLHVKGIAIGEGRSKLIVPISENLQSKFLKKARELSAVNGVDVVELRLDPLDSLADDSAIACLSRQVYELVGRKALLVTMHKLIIFHHLTSDFCGIRLANLQVIQRRKALSLEANTF